MYVYIDHGMHIHVHDDIAYKRPTFPAPRIEIVPWLSPRLHMISVMLYQSFTFVFIADDIIPPSLPPKCQIHIKIMRSM